MKRIHSFYKNLRFKKRLTVLKIVVLEFSCIESYHIITTFQIVIIVRSKDQKSAAKCMHENFHVDYLFLVTYFNYIAVIWNLSIIKCMNYLAHIWLYPHDLKIVWTDILISKSEKCSTNIIRCASLNREILLTIESTGIKALFQINHQLSESKTGPL